MVLFRLPSPGSIMGFHWSDRSEFILNQIQDLCSQTCYRIKYREAAGAVAANDLPDLAATVERTKTKLENSLVNHYTTLKRLAPQLSTVPGMILSPEDAHTDPILLPSRIDVAVRNRCGLGTAAAIEAKLRIAAGHEAVEATKKALGVRSWMTRHARSASNYTTTTRAQHSVRRSEMVVKSCAKQYNRHWNALDNLGVPAVERMGLQELTSDHLVVLGSWLENESYKPSNSTAPNPADRRPLPWIWRMHRVSNEEDATDEVAARVEAWNSEGEFVCDRSRTLEFTFVAQ